MAGRALFLLIAFGWSWAFFFLSVLGTKGCIESGYVKTWPIIVGALGPSIAAFIVTILANGRTAGLNLLRSGFQVRFSPFVYLFLCIVPLLIVAVANALTGGGPAELAGSLPLIFVLIFFLGGSIGEEFGWRGFLFPGLAEKYRPFGAALILGTIWAIWHLPLFWVEGMSQFTTPFWLYCFYILALSTQYAWLYLRTDGNLFACMLLHTFTNFTVTIYPLDDAVANSRFVIETMLNLITAILLFAIDRRLFLSPFVSRTK